MLPSLATYLLTLPERLLRSTAAVAGGLTRELANVAVPAALRETKLYEALAGATLRFLIEQVGQVEGAYLAGDRLAEDFALRRAAGNGLEVAGIIAFRASPVWVLAALADLSGAGRRLVGEIAAELQQEGLLDPATRFETVDQVLAGLEASAGRAAEAINTPPLDVAELRPRSQHYQPGSRQLGISPYQFHHPEAVGFGHVGVYDREVKGVPDYVGL